MRTIRFVLFALICLVVAVPFVVYAQEGAGLANQDTAGILAKAKPMVMPKQVPAFAEFMKLLEPCFKVDEASITEVRCPLNDTCYCMYYAEDPTLITKPGAYHDFGWYSFRTGCCAEYKIVRGIYYDPCLFTPTWGPDPPRVLPPAPAWMVKIPARFGPHGFWLNNQYPPNRPYINTGGHYFCDPAKGCDPGVRHMIMYKARYKATQTNYCKCDGHEAQKMAESGTVYLIFWEDWCKGGDWDWNDFRVALIPCGKQ
jgi:hypothetical protein